MRRGTQGAAKGLAVRRDQGAQQRRAELLGREEPTATPVGLAKGGVLERVARLCWAELGLAERWPGVIHRLAASPPNREARPFPARARVKSRAERRTPKEV